MHLRYGDLQLTDVMRQVQDLPHPHAVWREVIGFIARTNELRQLVHTVTVHRNDDDAGQVDTVDLPDDVLALLSTPFRHGQSRPRAPFAPDWQGGLTTKPDWLNGEYVVPVTLLHPDERAEDHGEQSLLRKPPPAGSDEDDDADPEPDEANLLDFRQSSKVTKKADHIPVLKDAIDVRTPFDLLRTRADDDPDTARLVRAVQQLPPASPDDFDELVAYTGVRLESDEQVSRYEDVAASGAVVTTATLLKFKLEAPDQVSSQRLKHGYNAYVVFTPLATDSALRDGNGT